MLLIKREREERIDLPQGLHGYLELWLFSPYLYIIGIRKFHKNPENYVYIYQNLWTLCVWLITCIYHFNSYLIQPIFMLILYNYDACYHSFMNFLHWYAILLKSIFMHYLGLIMCFIDVWSFARLNNWKLTTFLELFWL